MLIFSPLCFLSVFFPPSSVARFLYVSCCLLFFLCIFHFLFSCLLATSSFFLPPLRFLVSFLLPDSLFLLVSYLQFPVPLLFFPFFVSLCLLPVSCLFPPPRFLSSSCLLSHPSWIFLSPFPLCLSYFPFLVCFLLLSQSVLVFETGGATDTIRDVLALKVR